MRFDLKRKSLTPGVTIITVRRAITVPLTSLLAVTLGLSFAGPVAAASNTVNVASSAQLASALADARPGQTIALADGQYVGEFTAQAKGTSSEPITVVGTRNAVLTTGSTRNGVALTVTNDFWRLTGFGVSASLRGVVLIDADDTAIDGLEVASVGREAISVTNGSRDVSIRNSVIRDTGLTDAGQGDGIVVGSPIAQWAAVTGSATLADQSDRVIIEGNTISTTAGEGIDIKEGTRKAQIRSNVFSRAGYSGQAYADSWVDIKGDDTVVESNSGTGALVDAFQVHSAVPGWGGDNVFRGNTADDVPGYEVRVESDERGNTVACGPTGAGLGMSNVACEGPSGATAPVPTPAPTPTTAPAPQPTATVSPAPSDTTAVTGRIFVSTAAQLTAALKSAKPGQTIELASGTYKGAFVAAVEGSSSRPITLSGPSSAVLTTGSLTSGYGLHVTGDYWRLTGFSISNAQKGLVLDGSNGTVIDSLNVGKIGEEAVHVRTNSTSVVIRNSAIHDTGLVTPDYGEGIYIGSAKSNWKSIMGSASTPDRSDRVLIENNTITNTSAEGIDVKEGTTGGIVRGNLFTRAGYSGANYADSWVDAKGNGYLFESNSGAGTLLDAFQVHSVLAGWGGGNMFRTNTVTSGVPGYEVRVESSEPGNKVYCKPSGARLGLTNVKCS